MTEAVVELDEKEKPVSLTGVETKTYKRGDYTVEERISKTKEGLRLYRNGAVLKDSSPYRYGREVAQVGQPEDMVHVYSTWTDAEGREVVRIVEHRNFGKVIPVDKDIIAYYPNGIHKALYGIIYDAAGNIALESFDTYYPESGNIAGFQQVIHESIVPNGFTIPKHDQSEFTSRDDDAEKYKYLPLSVGEIEIKGSDYLEQEKESDSLPMKHRQEVLSSFPRELLELVGK